MVIIHEFGHYIFARRGGITVIEFSLGMGPRLFSFDAAGTKWSVKLFPIGGSCMMEGEDNASESEGAFGNKPVLTRILTVFGGPLFNFILAFLLSLFVIGVIGYDKSEVVSVTKGYPAAEAGIRAGDVITKINDTDITIGREISSYLVFNPLSEKTLKITVKRGEDTLTFDVLPREIEKFYLGFSYNMGDGKVVIESLTEDGAMKAAGVTEGDVITAINGKEISTSKELNEYFISSPLDGSNVSIDLVRAGTNEAYRVEVAPKSAGVSYTIGMSHNLARTRTGIAGTVYYALNETKYLVVSTVESLKMMVTGRVKAKDIAGPVGIVSMIGDSYEQSKSEGLLTILLNMANISIMISANLGVMNLLPIPALDGGRLIFLFIEAIRRKPLDPDKEGMVHMVGFALLMILMVVILFNDIMRIIG